MKPLDQVTFWRDPALNGIEICRVDGSRHVFPDHAHDGIYAIGLMEAGGSYCQGPQKSDSLVAPGQIALINPSQVHSGVPVRGERTSYCMVYLDLALVVAAFIDLYQKAPTTPEFRCMVMDEKRVWRRLQRFCRTVQGPGGQLQKESALMDALAGVFPLCSPSPPNTPVRRGGRKAVRRAMEFLTENLDQKMSLDSVARSAGLSRYHFLRVFKRETGLSPHLFRTLRRVDRARQLLGNGTPLAEAALMVGFSDQSHFTNTFHKYTGATPGQYAAQDRH
jgi:AraC-like DNA-binding protein